MRWIVRILGVVVLLVVVLVAGIFLIPTERIARLATDQFASQTGRGLEIGGPVRPTLWPTLGIRVEDVRLDNADWSDQGPMLQADRTLENGVFRNRMRVAAR